MEEVSCRPCQRLKQSTLVPSAYWCIQCSEMLCVACFRYHKVLKITKDHSFLTIDEYKPLANILSMIPNTCSSHEQTLKFLCVDHDVPCCQLCKTEDHPECTFSIAGYNDNLEKQIIQKESDKIKALIDTLDKANDKILNNLSSLDERREAFHSIIKQKTETLLTTIEDLKIKSNYFEEEYQKRKEEIGKQQKSFIVKRKNLEVQQETLNAMQKLKSAPVSYSLALKQLCLFIEKEENFLQTLVKSLCTVKCTFDIRIQMKNSAFEVMDKISFTTLSIDLDERTEENSSSTVENENVMISQSVPSNNLMTPAEQPEAAEIKASGGKHVHQRELLLKRTYYFRVEKQNTNVFIRCLNILPMGHIIFGEQSKPRLMVYEKKGMRKCELLLKSYPEAIAVDNINNLIYVSSGQFVLKIDAINYNSLVIINQFPMNDICYGVGLSFGAIKVNCINDGLKTVMPNGKIVSVDRELNGKFKFKEKGKELVLIRNGSSIIEFNCSKKLQSMSVIGECGFDTDNEGNIIISSPDSNRIYAYDTDKTAWQVQLDIQPYKPMGVALDTQTKELVVIVDGGKSIWTYSKQF